MARILHVHVEVWFTALLQAGTTEHEDNSLREGSYTQLKAAQRAAMLVGAGFVPSSTSLSQLHSRCISAKR